MNATRNTTSATISPADLAKVARRHDNIPQDALPGVAQPDTRATGSEGSKATSPKSVKWQKCPFHAPSAKKQLTGLIQLDSKTLVFRDHTKTVGKHVVPCPGSGVVWVDGVVA